MQTTPECRPITQIEELMIREGEENRTRHQAMVGYVAMWSEEKEKDWDQFIQDLRQAMRPRSDKRGVA